MGRGLVRRATYGVRNRLSLLRPRLFQKRRLARYCQGHAVRKLHLGAGTNILAGWLNTDGLVASSYFGSDSQCEQTVFLDVSKRFPLPDKSFDYVFHEHLIEHLTYAEGQVLLRECFRVLKPGGRLRVATPDFETFVRLYTAQTATEREFIDEYVRMNSEVWSRDLADVKHNKAVFVINHALRAWGHQFLYDFATLAEAMRAAGFSDITRHQTRVSCDSALSGLELRTTLVGTYDALIVEGRKV
jgi:predicted SAM-dependent methyltransferase